MCSLRFVTVELVGDWAQVSVERTSSSAPPRLRARQSLGRQSTWRPALGRKEALALTSCAKLSDAGIVGKNQKDHIQGCKGINEEGGRVGSWVEAVGSCSAGFHGKRESYGSSSQIKGTIFIFFEGRVWGSCQKVKNYCVRVLEGKIWVYYWFTYPQGTLPPLTEWQAEK